MINWKRYQKNAAAELAQNLSQRGNDYSVVTEIVNKNKQKNELQRKIDALRHAKKTLSDQWKTATDKIALQQQITTLNNQILTQEQILQTKNKWLRTANLELPNYVSSATPFGKTAADNVVLRSWGEPKQKCAWSHERILTHLKMIERKRTVAFCGSRFITYQHAGSAAKRALTNFLLDQNIQAGYAEIDLPLLVKQQACYGTGQLPKFHDDLYLVGSQQALISTSEISLVNFWANYCFDEQELPLKMTAFSPCFRKEAGAAGKDQSGLIRLHQFHKVEIVRLENPANSAQAHQAMVSHTEHLLQLLGLPYRVVQLCSGDLGFSAAQTYDLEVWMAHSQQYCEISSVSECLDFQAVRSNIKFKNKATKQKEYVFTLNGSALAIDRLIAALSEYYYDPLQAMIVWPTRF